MKRFALSLTAVCALLLSACANPDGPSPDDGVPPAPPTPPAYPPLPAAALNWKRLDTINNCHVYVLAYEGRTYLLATSEASNSSGGRNVACALAPAG